MPQDLSQMSTEELLRLRNGAQQAPAQQPAPNRAPGIIMGRPKAPEQTTPVQAAQLDMEAQRLQIAQQKAAMEATEFQQKQEKQNAGIPRDMEDVRAELLGVVKNAGKARRLSDRFLATGFGADAAGNFGGTNAKDVQALLDTIGGNIAFDRLARMRAESPTGGALGNVTERELTLLQSTVASLDKSQSDAQFQSAMDEVIRSYGRVLAKLPGSEPSAILEEMFNGGASAQELTVLADGMGLDIDDQEDLLARIKRRDETGDTATFNVNNPNPPSGGGGPGFGAQLQAGLTQGVGDIVQGVGDTVGAFTDPFARVMADALGYDGSQMQSLGTVAREGTGLPDSPEGIGRDVRRFAAGALGFGGAARGVGAVASPGNVQNVLSTLGRTPIRDTAAGAAAGAGANVGQELGGTPGAIAGGLAGGIGGYQAANRAMSAATAAPNALAQAAGRQGVDMLPADAGGPVARAVTTGTRASPLSVGPVVNAAERQQQQFGDAVRRTAGRQGEVLDTQAAGATVRQGAERYTKETAQTGSRMYDRAANMAKGVRAIKPVATVQAVDAALARMKQNPAASPSDIASLEAFKARIAEGVSIQGLRDARTSLSQGVYDGKLRSGADQAMWKGILGNVADDIDAGLRSVGRDDAANAFRRADKFWSERVEFIDQALQPIIGRDGAKGGEEVLQAIEGMARGQRGGNARLSRVMSALSPEEAGNVRATLVDRLGRATPGAQDAQGQTFSAATFLTNWNKMTPQARASMFPDKATRDSLSDLATVAEGTKRGQAMANTSNTGVAVTSINVIGGGAAAAANLPATLLGAGSIYLTGKLMASPGFARLLARTSKMPPQAANRTFREQLGVLATREPALGGDINRLLEAVNDNGARLAAEEEGQQ